MAYLMSPRLLHQGCWYVALGRWQVALTWSEKITETKHQNYRMKSKRAKKKKKENMIQKMTFYAKSLAAG